METERMISEIKRVALKYSNRKINTFDTDITKMCNDVIEKLEVLKIYENTELTPKETECLKNTGWIPVSERLPEKNTLVLAWAKSTARGGDVCFTGSYDNTGTDNNGTWFLQSSAGHLSYPSQYEVVAWQPLPEPSGCGS